MASQEPEDFYPETVAFEKLSVAVGTTLTIETLSPVRKLTVHLMGYETGKSLLVSAPLREGKEILLDKNATIAVRFLNGKSVCAFESRVLYRSIQPYSYYHLAYPEEIEAQQVRSSERIESDLDTTVDSDFNIIGDWPKYGHIDNLSRTGARLTSTERLGEFGHELILNFDLTVSGINKSVSLASIVRNVDQEEDRFGDTYYVVGVQFLEMDDESRLALANYIYEQGHH